MVKKCIVQHDELGKPIGIVEITEFTDNKSFKDFEKLCDENHKAYVKRMFENELRIKAEKEKFKTEFQNVKDCIAAALNGIAYLLGIGKLSEEEIEASFKALLEKGENHDEEEH